MAFGVNSSVIFSVLPKNMQQGRSEYFCDCVSVTFFIAFYGLEMKTMQMKTKNTKKNIFFHENYKYLFLITKYFTYK